MRYRFAKLDNQFIKRLFFGEVVYFFAQIISLPKAYELVKQPGFPTIRVGARILIPVGAFNRWLESQSQKD